MIVELKNLVSSGRCEIITVEESKKNEILRNIESTMLPVLVDEGHEYDDGEQIEAHLEKHFTSPNFPSLIDEDKRVKELTDNRSPISDLNKWIRLESPKSKQFALNVGTFLREAENILAQNSGKGQFLNGDQLKFPDCILLPKLYHIRVVAREVTGNGDILERYPNLKRYMDSAMKTKAFSDTIKEIDLTKVKQFKNTGSPKSIMDTYGQ